MNIIENLVAPLKKEAQKKAMDAMSIRIDQILSDLEDADWDINAYAPRPNYHDGDETYKKKSAKRSFVSKITKPTHNKYIVNGPDIVERNDEGIMRLLKEVEELAGIQYDQFVIKLVSKIGSIKSATMTGNHVWDYSLIVAEKEDGSIQKWKTQTIVNFSKNGLAFNQFPTRKVK